LKAVLWQTFSDDEGEVDQPLAPLPDEPEVILEDVDEEIDADDAAPSVEPMSRADSELVLPNDDESKAPSPRPPHPLSMSFSAPEPEELSDSLVDLKPVEADTTLGLLEDSLPQMTGLESTDVVEDMDLSRLGPDGTAFEAVNDLSQLEPSDILLGGPTMDQSEDPFEQEAA
jgi:hypothetical protein